MSNVETLMSQYRGELDKKYGVRKSTPDYLSKYADRFAEWEKERLRNNTYQTQENEYGESVDSVLGTSADDEKKEKQPFTLRDEITAKNYEIAAVFDDKGNSAERKKRIEQLEKEKDILERRANVGLYDNDLSMGERIDLTAKSVGDRTLLSPAVIAQTTAQAAKDFSRNVKYEEYRDVRKQQMAVDNLIAQLERKADVGVLDKAGWEQLDNLKEQKEQLDGIIAKKYTTPMNTNSEAFDRMAKAQQYGAKATEGLNDTQKFWYDVGTSIAENASLLPLNAALPGASLAVMGAKSGADKMYEVAESGGSAAKALAQGATSGAIEVATEKMPLDSLLKILKGPTGKSIIKTIGKQAGEEFTEEGIAYILNFIADAAYENPNAQFSLNELLQSALAGGISGGIMGTGGVAFNKVAGKSAQQNTNSQNAAENAQNETQIPQNETQVPQNAAQMQQNVIPPAENAKNNILQSTAKEQKLSADNIDNSWENNESLKNALRLIHYSGNESELYSDSTAAEGAYNSDGKIGINLAYNDTTAMGRAVHEVGHDKTQTKQWSDFTKALDRIVAADGRLTRLMEDIDYAYRNSTDENVRASVMNEIGDIDETKISAEKYLKLTEIMLPNIAKGDTQLMNAIEKNRGIIDSLLDFIRGIRNKIDIKISKSESAMLDEAERQLVNLLRKKGNGSGTKYSVNIDSDSDVNYNEVKGGVDNEKIQDNRWITGGSSNTGTNVAESSRDVGQRGEISTESGIDKRTGRSLPLEDSRGNRIPGEIADKIKNTAIKENGKPVLLYHFTPNMEFEIFKEGDVGFHFGEESQAVDRQRHYNKNGRFIKAYLNIENPYHFGNDTMNTKPSAIAMKLYSQDILSEAEYKKVFNIAMASNDQSYNSEASRELRNILKSKGYDGLCYENMFEGKGTSYIALYPEQIIIVDDGKKAGTSDDVSFNLSADNEKYSLNIDISQPSNAGSNSKSRAVERRAVNKFVNSVSDIFGVEFKEKSQILKKQAWDIANAVKTTGTLSSEQMLDFFNRAFDYGKQETGNLTQRNIDLKKELHDLNIKPLKGREYVDFVMKYNNKIRFNKNGLDIDVVYQQLCKDYPEWFSNDTINQYDQMWRIGEVYDSIQGEKVSLRSSLGKEFDAFESAAMEQYAKYVDEFIDTLNSVSRYQIAIERQNAEKQSAAQNARQYTVEDIKKARELSQPLIKEIARLDRKTLFTPEDRNLMDDLLKSKNDNFVMAELESIQKNNPLGVEIVEMFKLKKQLAEIQRPIFEYNAQRKAILKQEYLDILATSDSWKDKSKPISYSNDTFERNIDDIVTDKIEAEHLKDILPRSVHKNVAKATRFKNKLRNQIRSFNIDTKKEYEINVRTSNGDIKGKATEADLIQMYGEKLITKSYLDKIGANTEKIIKTTNEFRKIYDSLFEMINDVYIANGYAPMEYRKDYFPHFLDDSGDPLLNKIGSFLGFDSTNMLPTEIAGRTHEFSPGRQWNSHALQRKGENTSYNVLKGFDNYIEATSNIIFLTEDIQNLRAFENAIRYKYSDAGTQAELDAIDRLNISENEKAQEREKILGDEKRNIRLNNFVQWLHEYTNILAGKKSIADRTIENMFGRGFYTLSKNIENRVAANLIAGNLSSALTNFIPLTQMTAEIKAPYILTAMSDTMKNFKNNDGFADRSDFLTNRFGSELLSLTTMQQWSNKFGMPMEIIDEFTSNVVTRARYLQNINNGMEYAKAMSEADEYAASLMADRSKGALPVLFESKNPLFKLFTMFQVEQNNQLKYLVKDLPRNMRDKGKKMLIWGLIKYSLFAFAFNWMFEKISGRKPALSPIDFLVDRGKDINKVKGGKMQTSEAIGAAAVDVVENLPYAASVLAVSGIDSNAGRIPVSGALPDISQIVKYFDDISAEKKKSIVKKELAKPIYNLAIPFAGGQAKKTLEALDLVTRQEGVQRSVQSDGSTKVQFVMDNKNPFEILQSAALGKWATKGARDYVDNNFKGLTKGQTENFDMFKEWGMENKEAFEKAKNTKALSDKQKELLDKLIGVRMQNEKAYEAVTTVNKLADDDNNGYLTQKEVIKYLDEQSYTTEQKAIIFEMLCPKAKNNPYMS